MGEKVIRVLVVSGSRAIRGEVGKVLSGQEMDVLSVRSTQEARKSLSGEAFDVLIVDEELPEVAAGALMSKAREAKRAEGMGVLVLVGGGVPSRKKMLALEGGADDFLAKPVDEVELVARVKLLTRMKLLVESSGRESELYRVMEKGIGELRAPSRRVRKNVTVMFSDIRGFTSFSERMAPTKVFDILNMHLARQAETVYRHKGVVDKYSGDEVMAFFQGRYMARRAVHCAVDIVEGLKEMENEDRKESIRVGIGINTGTVVLGDIGTSRRMTYTAIGDNVNLAARLCGIAKYFKILISESTYERVKSDKSLEYVRLKPARVKGKESPVSIYEVKRKRRERLGASRQ
jgi:adenylate cyclase